MSFIDKLVLLAVGVGVVGSAWLYLVTPALAGLANALAMTH
jgi:hypothetical protein